MGFSLPGLSLDSTLFLEKDTILCQCVEPAAWHSRENCVCSIFSLRTLSSLLASEADAFVFRAKKKGKCFKKILKINYLSGKVKSSVNLFAKRTRKESLKWLLVKFRRREIFFVSEFFCCHLRTQIKCHCVGRGIGSGFYKFSICLELDRFTSREIFIRPSVKLKPKIWDEKCSAKHLEGR